MRKKILTILVVALGLYLLFGLGRQIMDTINSGKRLEASSLRLEKVQEDNKVLKETLQKSSSDEFLEETVRNKLNFAKEGETILVLPPLPDSSDQSLTDASANFSNWRKWLGLFID